MTDIPAGDVQATTSDDVYLTAARAHQGNVPKTRDNDWEGSVAWLRSHKPFRAAVDAAQAHGAAVERARIVAALRAEHSRRLRPDAAADIPPLLDVANMIERRQLGG